MSMRSKVACVALLLLSGCVYHAREHANQAVCDLAAHPFDLPPPESTGGASNGSSGSRILAPGVKSAKLAPVGPAWDVQTTAFVQTAPKGKDDTAAEIKGRLKIPDALPGAEAALIDLPKDKADRKNAIAQLYPELPPLPTPPAALPGPEGHPYTLSELQQIAAEASPVLRQAASDVEAARGNLIQASAYPNPTVGLEVDPSNDGSSPGVQGGFVDQVIKTGGKIKLQAAAAEQDLKSAELALRRARSDLATQVRNAYFAVLVARETVRVNVTLASFTDEVYRLQADLLLHGFAAPYEPAALRAQAYTARLGLKQSIATYIYSWKQLVATIGLHQLPLSEVAGRVDQAIPCYDYDAALDHVLRTHTDVLTTQFSIDKARYNLKLAQITPAYPDIEFRVAVLKEYVLPPKQVVPTAQVSFPLPVWDQNKGNILAAEAALVRASEEPHRVAVTLTNNFAAAYTNYKNNLDALEYYRKFILPDQVRAYRGIYDRRRIDPNAAFGDLVQAQQTLAANVTTYLGILGQLWSSVVSVADFLQTDDLFQLSHVENLPCLPELDHLPPWICDHPCLHGAPATPGLPGESQPASGDPSRLLPSAPDSSLHVDDAKR